MREGVVVADARVEGNRKRSVFGRRLTTLTHSANNAGFHLAILLAVFVVGSLIDPERVSLRHLELELPLAILLAAR